MSVSKAAVFATAVLTAAVPGSQASAVTIQTGSEMYKASSGDPIGSYFAVAGNGAESAPGQVHEVLGGSLSGGARLQNNGSETGVNTMSIGDLWSCLDAGGITSTSSLVFGIGINETGPVGSNWVDITALEMVFELPGGGTRTFSLGPDSITIYNFAQGTSTAEAKVQIDFGYFDFMTKYNAGSTEQFSISAIIDGTDDGGEIIFLSSSFTGTPPDKPTIPEPASLVLLAAGSSLMLRRRV